MPGKWGEDSFLLLKFDFLQCSEFPMTALDENGLNELYSCSSMN